MSVIGFSSSPVKGGNVDRMVQALLEGSAEAELVNLHDLTFGPCLGCAHLCAPDNHYKLEDDLEPYYRRIREAEALVLGTPNYFGSMNSLMTMFLERLWPFRHNRFPLKGKPFAVVSSGGFGVPEGPLKAVEKRMTAYRARSIGSVPFNSEIAPCFSCGDGLACRVGSLWNVYGEEGLERLRKGADLFRRWEDYPEAAARIEELRIKLRSA
jgi:NAD(P)H-dependent FMN reductase